MLSILFRELFKRGYCTLILTDVDTILDWISAWLFFILFAAVLAPSLAISLVVKDLRLVSYGPSTIVITRFEADYYSLIRLSSSTSVGAFHLAEPLSPVTLLLAIIPVKGKLIFWFLIEFGSPHVDTALEIPLFLLDY